MLGQYSGGRILGSGARRSGHVGGLHRGCGRDARFSLGGGRVEGERAALFLALCLLLKTTSYCVLAVCGYEHRDGVNAFSSTFVQGKASAMSKSKMSESSS